MSWTSVNNKIRVVHRAGLLEANRERSDPDQHPSGCRIEDVRRVMELDGGRLRSLGWLRAQALR